MLHPTSEPPKNFGTPMLFNGRRKSITSDGLAEDNSPIPSYPGSQEADDTPTALRRNLTRTPYSPQSPSRFLQVTSRTGLVFLGVIAFSTSVGAMAWSSMGSSVAARPAPQTRQLGEVVNAEAIAAQVSAAVVTSLDAKNAAAQANMTSQLGSIRAQLQRLSARVSEVQGQVEAVHARIPPMEVRRRELAGALDDPTAAAVLTKEAREALTKEREGASEEGLVRELVHEAVHARHAKDNCTLMLVRLRA